MWLCSHVGVHMKQYSVSELLKDILFDISLGYFAYTHAHESDRGRCEASSYLGEFDTAVLLLLTKSVETVETSVSQHAIARS